MKAMLPLLCIAAVAGCDSNTFTRPLNGSITGALQRRMTEQQWPKSAIIACPTGS